MNAEQRAALRNLAEEATPGPWIGCGPSFGEALPKYLNEVAIDREGDEDDGYQICRAPVGLDDKCSADFAHIAAANPSTILQLLDYIETLEKDGARYRWLRDTCMDDPKTRLAVMNGFIDYETVDYVYGEGMDVAIDAAMKG